MRVYVGIDNGVTGSIARIAPEGADAHLPEGYVKRIWFAPIPVIREQSYTKAKAQITRIDFEVLRGWLGNMDIFKGDIRVFIERPFVNPKGFKATVSALRALEATLICVEFACLAYEYIDSRQWQKVMLPKGCKGPDLKTASRDIGCRLFPEHAKAIRKHKDADSLLIAEWARRAGL